MTHYYNESVTGVLLWQKDADSIIVDVRSTNWAGLQIGAATSGANRQMQTLEQHHICSVAVTN